MRRPNKTSDSHDSTCQEAAHGPPGTRVSEKIPSLQADSGHEDPQNGRIVNHCQVGISPSINASLLESVWAKEDIVKVLSSLGAYNFFIIFRPIYSRSITKPGTG